MFQMICFLFALLTLENEKPHIHQTNKLKLVKCRCLFLTTLAGFAGKLMLRGAIYFFSVCFILSEMIKDPFIFAMSIFLNFHRYAHNE